MRLIPPNKVEKVPVLQSISGLSLTSCAAEVLWKSAKVMSEGCVVETAEQVREYSGSTYVDVDLKRAGIDMGLKDSGAETLLSALQKSIFFRIRLMRLSVAHAKEKFEGLEPVELKTEMSFQISAEGGLSIDISVECELIETEISHFGVQGG